MELKKSLSEWNFSEPRLANLPLDKDISNTVRRAVPGAVFSPVLPTPWQSRPRVVCVSQAVLRDIMDLEPGVAETEDFADWVGGNTLLPGSIPLTHRYGGHQFGHWAGQLGDGRAHLLGEYINRKGERWELQLKGSGRTPYSRFGDGRAVLRSSVREFLCSEAMFALGVPSSRAASLVVVRDTVPRDMFYDGRLKMERGAVVLRLAPTWFRFGSLEVLAINGEILELRQLADFVLEQNFPHIPESGEGGYLAMFQEVTASTAEMIARWTAVGFVHGVMNTDNMSLASITIDYGPFGFVDGYDPDFTPNHSDDMGRYDLKGQANIGLWNLDKLATALKPLLAKEKHKQLEMILKGYSELYETKLLELWRSKLGMAGREEGDAALVTLLLDTMTVVEADFTQTFRDLGELSLEDLKQMTIPASAWGLHQCMKHKQMKEFLRLYVERMEREEQGDTERMEKMQSTNPRYVLRNWMAQKAIEMAENDDFSEVQFLHRLLQDPYKVDKVAEEKGFAQPPPKWAQRLAVSCSS